MSQLRLLVAAALCTAAGAALSAACEQYQGYPVCRCQEDRKDGSDVYGPLCEYPGGDTAVTTFVPLGSGWEPDVDFGVGDWTLYSNGTVDGIDGKFKCCNVQNAQHCCNYDELSMKLDSMMSDADAAFGAGCCARNGDAIAEVYTLLENMKVEAEAMMRDVLNKAEEMHSTMEDNTPHQYLFYNHPTDDKFVVVALFDNDMGWNVVEYPRSGTSAWTESNGRGWISDDRKEIWWQLEQKYFQCHIFSYEDDNLHYPQYDLKLAVDGGNNCEKIADVNSAVAHCAKIKNVGTAARYAINNWQAYILRCYTVPDYSQYRS